MELIRYAVAVLALAVLGKPSRDPQPPAPDVPARVPEDAAAYSIGDMEVREVTLRGEPWREVYINDVYIGMSKAEYN
jgi:hypothetical protein